MTSITNPNYKFGKPLDENFYDTRSKEDAVGVIMGSRSDWPYMKPCCDLLEAMGITFEFGIVSAHRTPDRMVSYARSAEERNIRVIIACAGGSAHLPGMTASETLLPVLAVAPKKTDEAAIGSMIEMPEGIPLAYMGGGSAEWRSAGAVNAALFACAVLALHDASLGASLKKYRDDLGAAVPFTCY